MTLCLVCGAPIPAEDHLTDETELGLVVMMCPQQPPIHELVPMPDDLADICRSWNEEVESKRKEGGR